MRLATLLLAAAAALTAGAAQAASVEIRDAVVRVTVIPEARSDVRVEVTRPNAQLPLSVRDDGGRTVIDGDLRRRIRGCHGDPGRSHVQVSGIGDVGWDQMPQVVVHTPRAVVVSANGAVAGEIGRSASVALSNSGCSHWTLADSAGDVSVSESGAGSIRMGAVNQLEVHLSGASQIHAVQVRQGMQAHLSGAGGVKVDQLMGPLDARVSGVGHVNVAGGRASAIRAQVSGVGGVEFGGTADSLDASISGFGGVKVRSVTGSVRKSVSGIGHVTIGD